MSRELDTRSFDGGGRLLAVLAATHPRLALSLAGSLGALRHRVRRCWPTRAEVLALFPELRARDAARVAARIAADHERNRVLVHTVLRHGLDPIRPLVSTAASLATMGGPRILATFHVGALHALGAALERLQAKVLAFRSGTLFPPRGSLQVQSSGGDQQARAATLHRALVHLREGGLVVMALDVVQDRGLPTRCLGRDLQLAPGAFALARWTGAPIVPVTACWTVEGIRVDHGGPVGSPAEAAGWLERYLVESPSEITLGLLRMLLGRS